MGAKTTQNKRETGGEREGQITDPENAAFCEMRAGEVGRRLGAGMADGDVPVHHDYKEADDGATAITRRGEGGKMKPLLNGTNHGEELSGPMPITVMTTWRDLIVTALQENHQMDGRIDRVAPHPEQPAAGEDDECVQRLIQNTKIETAAEELLFWSWYKSC